MTEQDTIQRTAADEDPERDRIVGEEQRCLERVLGHMAERAKNREVRVPVNYDAELIALRDEIASARMEDVPPLLEQMERLQGLAATRREVSEGFVDPRSPYFGHLVLHEGERRREVLIGRSTYLDPGAGVRIVDWRDAPVSRLFYRCEEGEDYDEVFGEREVEGQVLVRRSVTILDGVLRRIVAPQGTFVKNADGSWRRVGASATRLSGGQGSAVRAEQHRKPGTLGIGDTEGREDTHLKEITALIDKRQFELITRPDSGLVVIQGGAGSGKTTIGLHRLAYLAYQDPRRFRPDRMLVVVFNDALARYISQVLPALGITGIGIRTYQAWANKVRAAHVAHLPKRYSEDTPTVATRLKKHPAMLEAVDQHVAAVESRLEEELTEAAGGASEPLSIWKRAADRALAQRLFALKNWLGGREGRQLSTDQRVALEGIVKRGLAQARDVVTHFPICSPIARRSGASSPSTRPTRCRGPSSTARMPGAPPASASCSASSRSARTASRNRRGGGAAARAVAETSSRAPANARRRRTTASTAAMSRKAPRSIAKTTRSCSGWSRSSAARCCAPASPAASARRSSTSTCWSTKRRI